MNIRFIFMNGDTTVAYAALPSVAASVVVKTSDGCRI